jgi:tripartite ATP-independent transporter DctM subunit
MGRPFFAVFDFIVNTVLAVALAGELIAVFAGVISRSVFGYGLLWTDDFSKIALSVMAFVGGAAAYRDNQHAFLRFVLDLLPERWTRFGFVLVEWLVIVAAAVTGWDAIPLIVARSYESTPNLGISAMWIGWPLAGGLSIMVIYALQRLSAYEGRVVALVGAVVAAVLMAAISTKGVWAPLLGADAPMILCLVVLLVTVLIGVPVGLALVLGAMIYLFSSRNAPMIAAPQNMLDGVGHFVLLALPFFILAGMIMERGGISLRLVRFVHALVGHFRGGLLQVMVVSVYLVSGLSGSKIADVAAVGSVMRDMLRREKYSLDEGASVLAVSAAMGETIPPSIPMLILGSITSVSIAALFIGGLMPAAVVALCIMALIYVRARRSGRLTSARPPARVIAKAALGAVLPLLMPVILIVGILTGVATPTEVSSFAVFYGVLLACFLYRAMTLRQVWRAVIDGAILTGMVLFIVAAASTFAWSLTVALLPQRMIALITELHSGQWSFMIGTIVLMIAAGAVLEGLPALLILAPLLMPIAVQIGINPVHYSMVLLIAMGTGAFMPPIGIGFYICCAICNSEIESSSRAMIPYFFVLLIGLLLVALVPWFTLALPLAFELSR